MAIIRVPGGRIIVAYESVEDAIRQKSCIACVRYNEILPCKMYDICRADKKINEEPKMFIMLALKYIENRLTEI